MSNKAVTTEHIVEEFQELVAGSVLTNERIARSLGVSVVDWQAFSVIARARSPLTAGELSSLTSLPTSTTTRVIDRLERQGFVERAPEPTDRRRVVVLPKPEVLARFTSDNDDNPYRAIKDAMRDVHEGFSVEELTVVERYLRTLNAAFH